jgi:MoxR-like ATPase
MRSRHQVDLSTRFSVDDEQPLTREIERAASISSPVELETVGREPYIADAPLQEAVNLSIALGRPLLVQGDPGVGKTRLAHAVAYALGLPLEEAYVKSTSRAQDLLYTFDAVRRLYDAQIPAAMAGHAPDEYVTLGPLGRAIRRSGTGRRSVVLIDEIDKADIDFPNDLLHELDRLAFDVPEVPGLRFAVPEDEPSLRPVVVVTDNGEKALPAAFLRRCVFHYIEFPGSRQQLGAILGLHEIEDQLLADEAIDTVLRLRAREDLVKKPGLSELLDWVSYLQATSTSLSGRDGGVPYLSALLKRHDDARRVRESPDAS